MEICWTKQQSTVGYIYQTNEIVEIFIYHGCLMFVEITFYTFSLLLKIIHANQWQEKDNGSLKRIKQKRWMSRHTSLDIKNIFIPNKTKHYVWYEQPVILCGLLEKVIQRSYKQNDIVKHYNNDHRLYTILSLSRGQTTVRYFCIIVQNNINEITSRM